MDDPGAGRVDPGTVGGVDLEILARAQHGVVTTTQAREGGLTPDALAWWVASGRWRRWEG